MKKQQRLSAFCHYYNELVSSCGLEAIADYSQHGTTSRLMHSVAVAYYSFQLAQRFKLPFRYPDLVRGALLHDYFLYDATDGDPARKGHWSHHPFVALENAENELKLTDIERDIIKKHMFPLTIRPPRYRESVVVSLVDKGCAVYEFFWRKAPYAPLCNEVLGKKQTFTPVTIKVLSS